MKFIYLMNVSEESDCDAFNPVYLSVINKSKDSMLGWFYYISRSYMHSIKLQESLTRQENFEDYNGLDELIILPIITN